MFRKHSKVKIVLAHCFPQSLQTATKTLLEVLLFENNKLYYLQRKDVTIVSQTQSRGNFLNK